MNDGGSQDGGQMVTLTVSKSLGSRTEMSKELDSNGKRLIYWSGDLDESGKVREQIYVSSTDGKVTGVLTLDPSSIEADPTTGTFSGFVFGDPGKLAYSVYPVPVNGQIDLTTRTNKYVDAPMLGEIKPDKTVKFDNTCGIRMIDIPNLAGQDYILSAKAGAETLKLGATAVVRINPTNDKPYLDFTSATESVTIENVPEGVFYVPFEITKNNKSGVVFLGKTKTQTTPIEITNAIDLSTAKAGALSESGAKIVHCVDGEIVEPEEKKSTDFTIKTPTTTEGNNVDVPTYTMNESSTNLTSVPEATNVAVEIKASEESSSVNPDEKVLSIGEVPQAVNTLIFTETTKTDNTPDNGDDDTESEQPGQNQPAQNEAKQKVTIALPETATNKTIDFNMPTSTVSVQSKSGENLTINKVTAATATNTFIIGSGVIINKLVAIQGAIEVAGEVKAIEKGQGNHYGNEKVKVKVKKGGKAPNLDKSIFDVEYEGDAPSVDEPEEPEVPHVSTLDALQTAIASGATNIILTKTITLTDYTFLNLNGKTLTLSEDFEWVGNAAFVSYGHTLKINGTIQGCQMAASDKYLIEVNDDPNKESNVVTSVGLDNAALITNGVGNAVKVVDTKLSVESSNIITSANGFAVNVKAERKAVQVDLGTKKGATIKGKVSFENNYSGSRFTVSAGSEIEGKLVTSGTNLKGLYIFVHPEVEVDHTSGWPIFVATVEDLQTELEENEQTVINLAAPITITSDLDLNGKTLVVDEEVWMSQKPQPEAAITVAGTDNAPIVISNGQIRGTSSKFDGFLIKATCKFNLDQVSLTAGQLLNGVEIVNSLVNIIESEITADKSSLHIFADTNNSVVQIVNSKIDSELVVFTNNYSLATETNPQVIPSALVVVEGSVVDSNIIIDGEYTKYLDIAVLDNGSLIRGDVVINGGNGPFELFVNEGGKVEGNNWPSQGNAGGGNSENEEVEVANTSQLLDALKISNAKRIVLLEPITIDVDLDLRNKTLSLSENFNFGDNDAAITFVSNNQDASFKIKNGTIIGSSAEQGNYLIKCSNHNLEIVTANLVANGNLNGVHVIANYCGLVYGASITVENGHAIKMFDNGSLKLSILDDVIVTGDIYLEANSAGLVKMDRQSQGQYGKVIGDIIISGSKATNIEVYPQGEESLQGEVIIIPLGDSASGKNMEDGGIF